MSHKMIQPVSTRIWIEISRMLFRGSSKVIRDGFYQKVQRSIRVFCEKNTIPENLNSALEEYPASCAVGVVGMIADWTCFGSKNIEVYRNAGLGVSTDCSLVSRSITMTFYGLFAQDTAEAWLKVCLVLGSMYITVSLHFISMRSKCLSASYRGERSWGQSNNQAVELSTEKKLLRFPVRT